MYSYSKVETGFTIEIFCCIFAENMENYTFIIGIQKQYLNLNISIQNCTFSSNRGGLLCDTDLYQSKANLYTSDTVFLGNYWKDGNGGALSIGFVDLKMQRCLVMNNSARSGGAIFYAHSYLSVKNTVFEHNHAS